MSLSLVLSSLAPSVNVYHPYDLWFTIATRVFLCQYLGTWQRFRCSSLLWCDRDGLFPEVDCPRISSLGEVVGHL